MTLNKRPRTYSVRRDDKEPLLEVFRAGLRKGGARILRDAAPDVAPFKFLIETPAGEHLTVTAYLFRATKYHSGEGAERPEDEHRFQIKYGSRFDDYHYLSIPGPDERDKVTLFLGVHLEEGILVGCDPVMHNPTWFSKSVEFKDEQVAQVHGLRWYAWERERHEGGRRKRPLPFLSAQTEAIVGFTPENLLRYIELERIATGLDAGERLLLAETPPGATRHELEIELGLSAGEILDMIQQGFRLKVAVRGGAAQLHLARLLEKVPGVTGVTPIDEDAKPDFVIHYRGRAKTATVECKNVLRRAIIQGHPVVEYQKTRASKNDPRCGRYYSFDHCSILAACLHPATLRWEFRYCKSAALPPHQSCPRKVQARIPVGGNLWNDSIEPLLDELTQGRGTR
jgi:hypothetical protein